MASPFASGHERGSFHNPICLFDWWLTRPDAAGKKTIGVAGTTSRQKQAVRVFSSAAIAKRLDVFTLETVDDVCIVLKGLINRQRTEENGFAPKVAKLFTFGFPVDWEIFAENSFYGEESTTEITSKKTKQVEGEEARLPEVFDEVFEDAATEFPSGAGLGTEAADYTIGQVVAPVDDSGICVGMRDLEAHHNESTRCSLKLNSLEGCPEKSVSNSLNFGKCLSPVSGVVNEAINDERPKSYSGLATRSRRKLLRGAGLDREAAVEPKGNGVAPIDDSGICVGTTDPKVNQNDSTRCSLKSNSLKGCEKKSVSNSPLNFEKCLSPATGVVNEAINDERPKSYSGLVTRSRKKLAEFPSGAGLDKEAADETTGKGAAPVDDPGICVGTKDLEVNQSYSTQCSLKSNSIEGCQEKSVSNSPLNIGECLNTRSRVVNGAINDERPKSYSGLVTRSRKKLTEFLSGAGFNREVADETKRKGVSPVDDPGICVGTRDLEVNKNDSTRCSLKSNTRKGCAKKSASNSHLNIGKCLSPVSGVVNGAVNVERPKSYSGLATRSRRKLEVSGGVNVPSSPRDTLQEVLQDPDHEEEITTAKKAKRKVGRLLKEAGIKEKSATRKKIKRQINFEEQGTPGGREDKAREQIASPGKHIVSPECLSASRSRSGRLRLPTLEFWRNQIPVYDKLRNITGIEEELHFQTPDTGKSSRPYKREK